MSAARLITRNLAQYQRGLEKKDQARIKAAETATKVEGFRLHKTLKAELAQGRAGGSRFQSLSIIARKLTNYKRRRTGARKPLNRMAIPIRYRTKKMRGNTIVQVGLVDPNYGAKISKRWVHLGFLHQEGGQVDIKAEDRKAVLTRGRQLARMQDQSARFFFLRKETNQVTIPARPFIEPWWNSQKERAASNIEDNFNRKMAGERI